MTIQKIAVAGEIYSANVGDRAIHACLLHLLKHFNPAVETLSIDLSGRSPAVGTRGKQHPARWAAPGGFQLPLVLANLAAHQLRMLRGRGARLRQTLQDADLLVIGGGQLLMDDALNFPLKISALTMAAHSLGLPHAFSACGVGADWSALGGRLLRAALNGARSISLRDQLSRERLERLSPGLNSRVTFDPAIWAAEVYPLPPSAPGGCLGLGVISREEANLRLARGQRFSKSDWNQLWLDLIGELSAGGRPLELFTTGSPADQASAQQLWACARQRGWQQVRLAAPPASPQTLLATFSGYSLVVAARLHAAILANAMGISTIGLGWDQKVKAYYAECGRSDQCFDLTQLTANPVAQTSADLWRQPFPAQKLAELKLRALENARMILD